MCAAAPGEPHHSMIIPTADYSDAAALAEALMEQADALAAMGPDVAKARTVLAYSGDRLKRALSLAIHDAQAAGATSYAAAEAKARASTAYRDAIDVLASADEQAEKIVAAYRAAETKWESLRTCTSLQKEIARQL